MRAYTPFHVESIKRNVVERCVCPHFPTVCACALGVENSTTEQFIYHMERIKVLCIPKHTNTTDTHLSLCAGADVFIIEPHTATHMTHTHTQTHVHTQTDTLTQRSNLSRVSTNRHIPIAQLKPPSGREHKAAGAAAAARQA